jgi:hypothetical protein
VERICGFEKRQIHRSLDARERQRVRPGCRRTKGSTNDRHVATADGRFQKLEEGLSAELPSSTPIRGIFARCASPGNGAAARLIARTSPIGRMDTSVKDGWRESSRPELLGYAGPTHQSRATSKQSGCKIRSLRKAEER